MMDMTTMSTGMMLGMGIYHLVIFVFALLGISRVDQVSPLLGALDH